MSGSPNNLMPVYSSAPAPISALAEIEQCLAECHAILNDIHGMADRAVGVRGDETGSKPTPVPNGLLDQVLDSAISARTRLGAARERLCRIA